MPVFNCENTINQTLDTLLKQSSGNFNLYIVNNNSSEKTLNIINEKRDKRITILTYKEKQQCAAALNYGLKHISEDVIIRVDGDDIYDKDFVKQMVKGYSEGRGKILYSSYSFKYMEEDRLEHITAYADKDLLLYRMLFFCTIDHNVLYERKHIMDLGSYNEIEYGEDYDLWTRSVLKDSESIGSLDPAFNGCLCLKYNTCMSKRLKHLDYPVKISQNFIKSFLGIDLSYNLVKKVRNQPPSNRASYYSFREKAILKHLTAEYIKKRNIDSNKFLKNINHFIFYV